jgi:hypothetical protein
VDSFEIRLDSNHASENRLSLSQRGVSKYRVLLINSVPGTQLICSMYLMVFHDRAHLLNVAEV